MPGSNWHARMQQGVLFSQRTIALLSNAYLNSVYGQQEWQAAQQADPQGFKRKLLPIRIEDCPRPGLLGLVVSIDLFGRDADDARRHLLDKVEHAIKGRAKPHAAPDFPQFAKAATPPNEPGFPADNTRPDMPIPDPQAPPFSGQSIRAVLDSRPTEAPYDQNSSEPPPSTGESRSSAADARPNRTLSDNPTWSVPAPPRRSNLNRGSRSLPDPRPAGAPLLGHTRGVRSVSFSPDGKILATGSSDTTVRFWDVTDSARSGESTTLLTDHTGGVSAGVFGSYAQIFATCGGDVRLWNMTNPAAPQLITALPRPSLGAVRTLAFSPDGRTLATGSVDAIVRLWDLRNPAQPSPIATLPTRHTGVVGALAFSPDGHALATASSDESVLIWDVDRPGRLFAELSGVNAAMWAIAYSPDGRTLVFGGERQSVIIWNVEDARRPRKIAARLGSHAEGVRSLVFSPDGSMLFTGSVNQTVRIWDVANPVRPSLIDDLVTAHTGIVNAMAFSPDGRKLATGSSDTTVQLWQTRPSEQGT
ncbi:WD40 repeat, subgroup [Pseudofrankia inefficax]|uniref:WD40 repeat, subgroup n=1 Tax=Pseudofrankia inefficax (strain DSM 45817 / CECT 9037 / DDB 130130 / EuI1c) TaxID=298654 RepID=E3J6C2_PSEI1|nr:WD40 repeat, subgroup [Pseudofrankia inefficax]